MRKQHHTLSAGRNTQIPTKLHLTGTNLNIVRLCNRGRLAHNMPPPFPPLIISSSRRNSFRLSLVLIDSLARASVRFLSARVLQPYTHSRVSVPTEHPLNHADQSANWVPGS